MGHTNIAMKVVVEDMESSTTTFCEQKDNGKNWEHKYLNLISSNKEHLITLIAKSEQLAIYEAMLGEHDIPVPRIGTFKIKPIRRELMNYKSELYKSMGVKNKFELSPLMQSEVEEKLSIKAKELILKKKLKNDDSPFVKLDKNIVNNLRNNKK